MPVTAHSRFAIGSSDFILMLADEVFRVPDSPNEVIVTHDFAEPGHITAMVESAELHAALAQAGVVGEGTVWMGTPPE